MTATEGHIAWGTGATTDVSPLAAHGARQWIVRVESEPLGSLALDTAVARLADDAARLAPHAPPSCSLALGRLAMTLAIEADGPEDAADSGEDVFRRALEAALWPRTTYARLVEWSVLVTPAEERRGAA